MGYIQHHAIVVTSWDTSYIEDAYQKAIDLGLSVIGPSTPQFNGYMTLLIVPDGSKEGWKESEDGNEKRRNFREWLHTSTCGFEWAEVSYGYDPGDALITNHAWKKKGEE